MEKTTRVAVVGASGYAGEELVRLLLQHPHAELVAITSRKHPGKLLGDVFPRFANNKAASELRFCEANLSTLATEADIVFLAVPHGVSAGMALTLLSSRARIIDLSADFRLRKSALYREFYGTEHRTPELLGEAVYGLPEIYRDKIASARLVACPGCYPTSVLIPLRPLIRRRAIDRRSIIITSVSGVSGAGRKLEPAYLFVECSDSIRPYAIPKHRHLAEIEQELSALAGDQVTVQFAPHLVPVNRGILTTMHADIAADVVDLDVDILFRGAYADEPFVRLLGQERLPETRNVVGTNFIEFAARIDPRTRRVVVVSAIDNLTKGTSGQAVQCLNLMCGYPETTALL